MTTRFHSYGDTLEENCKGQMGSCGEGIYSEGGVCADRNEGEVFDVEVSGEGECEGFFERIEVEKGGVGAGGGNDQQSGLSVYYHFVPSRCPIQFCIHEDVVDSPADPAVNGC